MGHTDTRLGFSQKGFAVMTQGLAGDYIQRTQQNTCKVKGINDRCSGYDMAVYDSVTVQFKVLFYIDPYIDLL